FRTVVASDGTVKNIPYEEAFKRYLSYSLYGGIAEDYPEYALLFAQKGMSLDCIKRAMQLIDYAEIKGVPNHILGKPLAEPTIMEQIERLKDESGELIEKNAEKMQKLYDQMFTFEMLDKRSPINAIIGAYASCCAVIDNTNYGARIAKHSIIDENIQNMVVKDKTGEIIAKGTLYVNRAKGYAVFNDFELNYEYRKNESCGPGIYKDDEDSLQEIRRSKIFETIMRGMYGFMTEYNKQNEERPITKICVGYGYNRLKEYCNRYDTNLQMFDVPDYFEDAQQRQAFLYDDDNPSDRFFYKKWLEDSEIILKPKKEEIIKWD
ncbi:MAG: hypothetical protein J6T39_01850, partial [Clostridia bacterium]|nr:hypothetical protein [Clostridia bacterium]